MPLLGLGTFLSPPGQVGAAVKTALEIGYRHLDCAAVYGNEQEIGTALQEVFAQGKIKREDLFITSKLNARFTEPKGIQAQFDKTLADLKTSYLDLYLIHQPIPCKVVDEKVVPHRAAGFGVQDIWREFEKIYASGKAKAIGVSNFPTVILNDLLCYAKVKPAVEQLERHPYLLQTKHIKFCRDNGIQITAYGPLGSPELMAKVNPNAPSLLAAEPVVAIAKKYGKTTGQVLIRWALDSDTVSIPKSVNPERLKENFSVWDFKLSAEDMETLNKMDKHLRLFEQDWHTVPTFT